MDTYEKKYKEALEKARQLCAYPTTKSFISDLQDLFPELKESEDEKIRKWLIKYFNKADFNGMLEYVNGIKAEDILAWLKKQGEQKPADKVEPKFKVGEKELTDEELREGLIRGMINEHNRVVKEVLRTEYEKGRADVLAKIDAIDVDEMVCESGATSRVTQYWYAHGVNDVIKKLKEEQV